MRWRYKLQHLIRSLFRKNHVEQELSDELRFHLENLIEEKVAKGMATEEARHAAMREIGGMEQIKEQCREVRQVNYIEHFVQDVRYGVRMLRKSPGFTTVAVLTLALGIGANTAIFSIVNGILLRPLPFKNPERIVVLGESNPKVASQPLGASYQNFADWNQQNRVFEYMAGYRERRLVLLGRGEPQRLPGIGVTSSFFPLLGLKAHLGRTLTAKDEGEEQGHVVVISYELWQRLFGGNPAALGQTLILENVPRTIVGILPPGFRFLQDADFFTPVDAPAQVRRVRGIRFLRVMARLKPGVSLSQARSEMDGIARYLAKEYSNYDEGWGVAVDSLEDKIVGGVRQSLLVLLGTVGFVLLIACANIANLLLARGASRQRELAIRTALGAGKGRVVRLLLTESVLLAAIGGTLALAFAVWGIDALRGLSPANLPRLEEIRLDARVLGFTLLVTVMTGLLFGLGPVWQVRKVNLQETLKEGGRAIVSGRDRLRGLLVISEVALSLVLLVGAGLLGRSFIRLLSVNPGFRPEGLLSFDVQLPQHKYEKDFQQANFFRDLLDRSRALPGVRSMALTSALPLAGNDSKNSFAVEGVKAEEAEWATMSVVSPEYFRTLGIPLFEGRTFNPQDDITSPPVAVVSERLARKYWPSGGAIGKHLLFGEAGTTIIGVAGNVKDTGLTAPEEPHVYLPYWQQPLPWMTAVVEVEGDPLLLIGPVRTVVQSLDKDQPIEHVQAVEDLLARTVAQPKLVTLLLGAFSGLALVLVTVGIYGVISYSVSQRTHEIGIRMALGAKPQRLLALVLAGGLKLALAGVVIGLAGALVLTRLLTSLLFGVSATDPLTFSAVALLLIGVSLAACYLPARRAMQVDPMVALRYE